ncbi:MAG: cytochrome c [Planctomycetota bacterium]
MRGEEVFRKEAMCLTCHALDGQGGRNGPALDHVATKYVRLKGGTQEARRFLFDHLVDPQHHRVSKGLPPYAPCPSYRSALGEEKLRDVSQYLLTLE